ncbi:putative Glucose 1-dehydrogenase [Hibiscus syriacus]|uniref:RecQ-mediated genome instability protein 1 n=1 Tax=Hibiscus syriacus TaxID=106335 RepID=A0A6A3B1L9_HIBSY|nr:recQ-mediated genome instability protein 1-like [Hibiscus syriacus]KAE8710616.1 putative Glucose 1-dehydrogenase [Hibiscus syriacus]
MARRRLRLHCSSDEEDAESQQQPQYEPPQGSSAVRNQPVTVSPPDPNPAEPLAISDDDFVDAGESLTPSPVEETSAPLTSVESYGSPIADFLLGMGLKLRREWLDSCVQGLESSVPRFLNLDISEKAKLCFQQFLLSDMNYSGGGILPENVDSMRLVDLKGPFVLQVDEIVNISCPLKGRYQDTPGLKRCLKLSITDGVQRVFGMEYRPIKDLQVLTPAGLKVVICNVHIRRGLLMLVPESLEILGGVVEDLEAARQRLVAEVNKPPRGKRTKTGLILPLATRATLAALPLNGVNSVEPTNTLISQNLAPFWTDERGATLVSSSTVTERTVEDPTARTGGANAAPNSSSDVALDVERMHIDSVSNSRENAMSNSNLNTAPDNEHIHVVEHPLILLGDREVPFTYLASLSAKWAAIKDKATYVQGKIKCFLTGVKGFQYKQRTIYELLCYVDDGSLISEILIDHNVVQKGIGRSPQEVTAALSSSDKQIVSGMKETMRQFQAFLAHFEGLMLVEINRTTPLPIAKEMTQGCPASDARLLLRRLTPSSCRTPEHRPSDPIEISH